MPLITALSPRPLGFLKRSIVTNTADEFPALSSNGHWLSSLSTTNHLLVGSIYSYILTNEIQVPNGGLEQLRMHWEKNCVLKKCTLDTVCSHNNYFGIQITIQDLPIQMSTSNKHFQNDCHLFH